MSKNNKTIYPDNVADTSARGGVPPAMDGHRQAAVGGESFAGGEGGDGVDEDVGSARESGFSAGSTGTPAKRKNMRQQTFDAIAKVMDKHGALMADTVEGANKRQCSILERQCDILDREVEAQKRHWPSIPRIALSLGIWGGLPACGMGDRRCRRVEGCAGGRLGGIRALREGKCHREHYKGPLERYLVHVFWFSTARKATRGVSVVLRGEVNIARARRSLATSSQALWQSAFIHGACASDRQRMAPRGQQKPKRPHGGSGEAGAGQTGRGHIPKSKKLRAGDGSEGEMGVDGGEEVTPMDITSAGTPALGFGRDGVSRQHMLALTNLGVLTSTRRGGGGTARAQGVLSGDIPPQRAVGSASTIASVSERDDKAPVGESPSPHGGVEPDDCRRFAEGCASIRASSERRWPCRRPRYWRKARRSEGGRGGEKTGEVGGESAWGRRGRPASEREEEKVPPRGGVGGEIEAVGRRQSVLGNRPRTDDRRRDYPTDLARAVWQSLEWSRIVPPTVVYHTVALKMDIPVWFAGAYIENRPEDDDMAGHQEATVMHLASCFHDTLRAGQWWDGGRLSHQRLSRIGDAFRLLLAACMWIMRMGGDDAVDARSYEEASYNAQLVAKPTLVAACSSSFNWRRHVMHLANAVLSRLRKPPLTLGAFPDYISEWASCGVRYNCNAGLADPDVAARVD
ncbi:hypothetical protein CBR_g57137 [Chara braunii]|uniref:Uncharacterized protein n=1 Tax=Chara braunii TaxID=69332 RepID=A0A388ME04_CHABU|nr:hypothetical protein CBR_g57137 [Chara braunii]|eukprot:GBG92787.1 hypothetical protein CBR_g57137 [Chara braunii]